MATRNGTGGGPHLHRGPVIVAIQRPDLGAVLGEDFSSPLAVRLCLC